MFYQKSAKLLQAIAKAKNILINTHKNPDYDSVGSALALKCALEKMGYSAKVVACQGINPHFFFLEGARAIETIDYATYDFSSFDLFIVIDTGSADRATGTKEIPLPPGMEYIIIDHHQTNNLTLPLRLVDTQSSATSEILYRLFLDWGLKIDPEMATKLLTGILGDTVFLKYCKDNKKTFTIVGDLMEKGADKDMITENFYDRYDFDSIKLLGKFLDNMRQEENFVWSAVRYEVFEKFGMPEGIREMAADMFFRGIKGKKFGVAMLESSKGEVYMSFRSKNNTDVSAIAKALGGGGHKNAAGVMVKGEFDRVIKQALKEISRFS